MKMDNKLDPRLASLLGDLKAVPARDPRAASRARSQFLAQAVSAQGKARHSVWNIFSQKEQFAMKLITTTLVIVGLLFGGSATVAAGNSLGMGLRRPSADTVAASSASASTPASAELPNDYLDIPAFLRRQAD